MAPTATELFDHSFYGRVCSWHQSDYGDETNQAVLPKDVVHEAQVPVPVVDRVDDSRDEKTEGWEENSSDETDHQLQVREGSSNGNCWQNLNLSGDIKGTKNNAVYDLASFWVF